MSPPIVQIHVRGGVAYVHRKDEGVILSIIDYDNDPGHGVMEEWQENEEARMTKCAYCGKPASWATVDVETRQRVPECDVLGGCPKNPQALRNQPSEAHQVLQ